MDQATPCHRLQRLPCCRRHFISDPQNFSILKTTCNWQFLLRTLVPTAAYKLQGRGCMVGGRQEERLSDLGFARHYKLCLNKILRVAAFIGISSLDPSIALIYSGVN